jgi:putative transcriptional regulator
MTKIRNSDRFALRILNLIRHSNFEFPVLHLRLKCDIVLSAMSSTQGKLLLASPRLADPNFARSVVLMIQHNDQGALGLVLNHPLQITVRQACEQSLGQPCKAEGMLHQGGPCEGPLMVLHGYELAKDADVLPGVFFTTEKSKIESILKQQGAAARYFVGFAGWSPGQLEAEMEIESWIVADPIASHVFADKPDLWLTLMRQKTLGQWMDPSKIPDDPTTN